MAHQLGIVVQTAAGIALAALLLVGLRRRFGRGGSVAWYLLALLVAVWISWRPSESPVWTAFVVCGVVAAGVHVAFVVRRDRAVAGTILLAAGVGTVLYFASLAGVYWHLASTT